MNINDSTDGAPVGGSGFSGSDGSGLAGSGAGGGIGGSGAGGGVSSSSGSGSGLPPLFLEDFSVEGVDLEAFLSSDNNLTPIPPAASHAVHEASSEKIRSAGDLHHTSTCAEGQQQLAEEGLRDAVAAVSFFGDSPGLDLTPTQLQQLQEAVRDLEKEGRLDEAQKEGKAIRVTLSIGGKEVPLNVNKKFSRKEGKEKFQFTREPTNMSTRDNPDYLGGGAYSSVFKVKRLVLVREGTSLTIHASTTPTAALRVPRGATPKSTPRSTPQSTPEPSPRRSSSSTKESSALREAVTHESTIKEIHGEASSVKGIAPRMIKTEGGRAIQKNLGVSGGKLTKPDSQLFSQDQQRAIGEQLLSGLVAVHKKEIAHLDIKPDNTQFAIKETGAIKARLNDFGIAVRKDADYTKVTGTPQYMVGTEFTKLTSGELSPEEFMRRAQAIDVFSLAKTFFELITKEEKLPSMEYGHELKSNSTLEQFNSEVFQKLTDKGCPPQLASTIVAMLNPNYEERPTAELALRQLLPPLATTDSDTESMGEVNELEDLLDLAADIDIDFVEEAPADASSAAAASGSTQANKTSDITRLEAKIRTDTNELEGLRALVTASQQKGKFRKDKLQPTIDTLAKEIKGFQNVLSELKGKPMEEAHPEQRKQHADLIKRTGEKIHRKTQELAVLQECVKKKQIAPLETLIQNRQDTINATQKALDTLKEMP